MRKNKVSRVPVWMAAFCIFVTLSGCDKMLHEALEESRDRETYGYYELDIPDAGEGERKVSKEVTVEVYDPIDWIELHYTIINSGDADATVNVYVELLYYPELGREKVAVKKLEPHSKKRGVIDEFDSELLETMVEDSMVETDGDTVIEYPIKVRFKAVEGPMGLEAKFKIVVEEM